MPLPVIPALFKEMADARRKAGKSRAEIAAACGVGERTVERWENLEHLPLRAKEDDPGGDLARAVDGYAAKTERSPFDLWTATLDRAARERKSYEKSLKAPPRGPSPKTKRAVDAMRRQSTNRPNQKKGRAS